MYCRNCLVYTTEKEHHMKYKSRGGSDNPINLVRLCRTCHRDVHDHKAEWTKKYRTYSFCAEGITEYEFDKTSDDN